MPDDKKYWIGFNLCQRDGSVRFQQIQSYFGTFSGWHAPAEVFNKSACRPASGRNFLKLRQDLDIDKYYENILKQDMTILTLLEDDYPRLLRQIDQALPVIYIKGELTPADEFAVALLAHAA